MHPAQANTTRFRKAHDLGASLEKALPFYDWFSYWVSFIESRRKTQEQKLEIFYSRKEQEEHEIEHENATQNSDQQQREEDQKGKLRASGAHRYGR